MSTFIRTGGYCSVVESVVGTGKEMMPMFVGTAVVHHRCVCTVGVHVAIATDIIAFIASTDDQGTYGKPKRRGRRANGQTSETSLNSTSSDVKVQCAVGCSVWPLPVETDGMTTAKLSVFVLL